MSKKLMRVPLSFSWPLHKVWGGYLNPYGNQCIKCPDCELGYDRAGGRPDANAALFYDQWYGYAPFDPAAYGADLLTIDHPAIQDRARRNVDRSPSYYLSPAELAAAIAREARRLHDLWRGQWCHHLIQADVDALVEADRLWDFTRRPLNEDQAQKLRDQEARGGSGYWLEEPNGHRPTVDEVNAWSIQGLGHDAINQGACVKARCKREGVPSTCARCEGSGHVWPTPEVEKLCEDWEGTEPPAGDGYQLWETCSEGSPVSPVFATLDDLCAWCVDHATTFADFKATKEEWKTMLEDDFVHADDGKGHVFL